MSLVAYDSSDESDEDIKKENDSVCKLKLSATKKQRGTIKISIPSLKEFEEDDDSSSNLKRPKLQGGSGLFSLLPPPKNSCDTKKPAFIPYTLTKRETKSDLIKNEKRASLIDKAGVINKRTEAVDSVTDGRDSDDDILSSREGSALNETHYVVDTKVDFFSLDSKQTDTAAVKVSVENNDDSPFDTLYSSSFTEVGSSYMLNSSDQPCEVKDMYPSDAVSYNANTVENNIISESNSSEIVNTQETSISEASNSFLEDEEFLKLKGRKYETVDIIDVKADDQLADRNEWILKSLTEEIYRPSRKRHNMPTSQQKRKHQITYLAFQAKERELDLKNQWAMNSKTKRETQAKYGF